MALQSSKRRNRSSRSSPLLTGRRVQLKAHTDSPAARRQAQRTRTSLGENQELARSAILGCTAMSCIVSHVRYLARDISFWESQQWRMMSWFADFRTEACPCPGTCQGLLCLSRCEPPALANVPLLVELVLSFAFAFCLPSEEVKKLQARIVRAWA